MDLNLPAMYLSVFVCFCLTVLSECFCFINVTCLVSPFFDYFVRSESNHRIFIVELYTDDRSSRRVIMALC